MNTDDITTILTFTNAKNIYNVLTTSKYIYEMATNNFWKTIYYSNSRLLEKYKNKTCNYHDEFINFTKKLPMIIPHQKPLTNYCFSQKILNKYMVRNKFFICYNERGIYRDTYIYEKLRDIFLESMFNFLSDNIRKMPRSEFYLSQIDDIYVVFHKNNFWAITSKNDIFYIEYDNNLNYLTIMEIGEMYVVTKQYIENTFLINKSSVIVATNKCKYTIDNYLGNKN